MEKQPGYKDPDEEVVQSVEASKAAAYSGVGGMVVGGVAGVAMHDPVIQKAAKTIVALHDASGKFPDRKIVAVTDDVTKDAINAYLKKGASNSRLWWDSLGRWHKGTLAAGGVGLAAASAALLYKIFTPSKPAKDAPLPFDASVAKNKQPDTDLNETKDALEKQKSFVEGLQKKLDGKPSPGRE